jgi:hypothetical protein
MVQEKYVGPNLLPEETEPVPPFYIVEINYFYVTSI